ncbi:biphenyl-2,3-diol 1,2-dioxygenase III-related protein [Vibrio cholerae CP1046(19)]|nr:biphenyl-2,3-diol 1,2-dioxygenase III-related protein [Vibrio cholerae CP1046(19)]
MKAVSFGAGRIALEFGHQKINLHQLGNEFEPKAQNSQSWERRFVLYYRHSSV